MGIRITAFAFNASRLQRVLEPPLWQLLGRLCQLPPNEETRLFSVYDPERRHRYHIGAARQVIRLAPGQPVETLDDAALSQIPVLRQSTAQYLTSNQGDSYDLAFLLTALASETTDNVARPITDGYRGWWIGSLLTSAQHSPALSGSDFEHLRDYCARILRVYDCGFPLDGVDRRSRRSLAYLPTEDTDYYMCLFDATDAGQFVDLLERLHRAELRFVEEPPPLPRDQPLDWNSHVRDRMAEFLTWRALSPPHDHLITFIG